MFVSALNFLLECPLLFVGATVPLLSFPIRRMSLALALVLGLPRWFVFFSLEAVKCVWNK